MGLDSVEPRLLHGRACQLSDDDGAKHHLVISGVINRLHDGCSAHLDRLVDREVGVTSPELLTDDTCVPDSDVGIDKHGLVGILDSANQPVEHPETLALDEQGIRTLFITNLIEDTVASGILNHGRNFDAHRASSPLIVVGQK